MPQQIRILLVDDHAVLRAGLRALLEAEPGFLVVGEAGTGRDAVAVAADAMAAVAAVVVAATAGADSIATTAARS